MLSSRDKRVQVAHNTLRHVVILTIIFTSLSSTLFAEEGEKTETPFSNALELKPKWNVLHFSRGNEKGVRALKKKSPFQAVDPGFKFTGPAPNDPFLLGDVTIDGTWAIMNGMVQQVDGRNAALIVAQGENFELQGLMDASGVGGWFFLVGWKGGHGYAIYNVKLKTSGSPWLTSEFRGGKGLAETNKEFIRFECKGKEPVLLSVKNKKLNLQIGRVKLAIDKELPNYHAGSILIGTYDTRYGPKKLKIQSLRIRSLPDDE